MEPEQTHFDRVIADKEEFRRSACAKSRTEQGIPRKILLKRLI